MEHLRLMPETIAFEVPFVVADAVRLDNVVSLVLMLHPDADLRYQRQGERVMIRCSIESAELLSEQLREDIMQRPDVSVPHGVILSQMKAAVDAASEQS